MSLRDLIRSAGTSREADHDDRPRRRSLPAPDDRAPEPPHHPPPTSRPDARPATRARRRSNTDLDHHNYDTPVLNEQQTLAVESEAQYILINAGAGTGKTHTLAARIARRTRRGLNPSRVMINTFGAVASGELRDRISRFSDYSFPWLETYHSNGMRILRDPDIAEYCGLTSRFSLIDRKDRYRVIRGSINEHAIGELLDASAALQRIDRWKNEGITATNVETFEADRFEAAMKAAVEEKNVYDQQTLHENYSETKNIIKVFIDYERIIHENNVIDFNDMILLPVTTLWAVPELQERWQKQFDGILVDEYQDTNPVQYDLVRFLLAPGTELCCVGDDDQAIFGWRSADIRNILSFRKDFPDAIEIKLEQNFRSSQQILDLANRVVSRIPDRLGKTLWSARKDGNRPILRVFPTDTVEAAWIVDDIHRSITAGESPDEHAVLVRVNRMTRVLEFAFAHRNLPYCVVGASFYDQEEIQDLIAYLELAHDPRDQEAFLRIVNKPRRGIGKFRMDMITSEARAAGSPPHVAMRHLALAKKFNKKVAIEAIELADFIDVWHQRVQGGMSLVNLLDAIIAESHYKKQLRSDVPEETADRLENLQELLFACEGFKTLDDLLRQASRKKGRAEPSPDEVRIMSLHRAKGTEFGRVYIAGFEKDKCPHMRAPDRGQAGIDEERRLAYVGLSRGKHFVNVCQVQTRAGKDVGNRDLGPIFGPMSNYIEELGDDRKILVELWLDDSLRQQPGGGQPPPREPPVHGATVVDTEFTTVDPKTPDPQPTLLLTQQPSDCP